LNDAITTAVLDAIPIGLAVLDANGKILQANPSAALRARRTARDLVGQDFFATFGLPEGKAAFAAAVRASGPPAELALDLDASDAVVRIRSFSNGPATGCMALFEPAHSDARMRRLAEAWEAAFAIVREVRHEINNPLMGVMGQVELLQTRTDLTPPVAHKIASIRHESERIRAMAAKLGEIKRV
jgi:nitrogen-specific signal transduction histidine kinase